MKQTSNKTIQLPPRPKAPDPGECCGRGCEPCVYTYYERALERWHKKVAQLRRDPESDK